MVISSSNIFLHSYTRKKLIGIKESFHPPLPKFPYQAGESQCRGQAAWGEGGWWVVVVAWNWGAVTNFSFPLSPSPKLQKPLKTQCKPALPGRAWGCEGGKYMGPGQPSCHIPPQPYPYWVTPWGSLIK